MTMIDELKKMLDQNQTNQPVQQTQNQPQQQQGSWVQNLIDQHTQSGTERLKRSPQGFNFQREPFDPSSYYKQLGTLRDISTTATNVSNQEAMNRQAQFNFANSSKSTGSGVGAAVGNAVGKISGKVGAIIQSGMKQLGKPYIFGNEGPNSFDCSGLMQYIFKRNGVNLPRTAAQQQKVAKRVSHPVAGDLVFYGYPAHHVALYLGNGKMLAAPHSGAKVRVQPVYGKPTYGRI